MSSLIFFLNGATVSVRSFFSQFRELLYPTIQGNLREDYFHKMLTGNITRLTSYLYLSIVLCVGYVLSQMISGFYAHPRAFITMTIFAGTGILCCFLLLLQYVDFIRATPTRQQWILYIYIAVMLCVGVGTSLTVQGYTNQISTFIIFTFGLMASFRLPPLANLLLVSSSCLILNIGLYIVQHDMVLLYTLQRSSIIASIAALTIGQLIARMSYHDFIQRKTIEYQAELIFQQNHDLHIKNTALQESLTALDEKMRTLDINVTELRKQKSLAELYYQQNVEFQDIKERFVKSAIHDLKNPLTGLMLTADSLTLGKRKATLTDQELGTKISEVARRILLVVNSLINELNFFSPQLLPDSTDHPTTLEPLIQDIYTAMAHHADRSANTPTSLPLPLHNAEGLSLPVLVRTVMDDLLPLAERKEQSMTLSVMNTSDVFANRNDVIRIVENLISNAIKYTNSGGYITITISADEEYAILRIADTGIGILPEHLAELFTHQEQAMSSPLIQGQSSHGIGLQSAYTLAKAMGGTILADSAGKDQGSIFTVLLPLYRVPMIL